MEEQLFLSEDLPIDPSATSSLKETTYWTRFLTICFVVFIVLMIVATIGMIVAKDLIMQSIPSSIPFGKLGVMGMIIAMALVIGVMSVFTYFLFEFTSQTKKAFDQQDQQALERGITGLKNYLMISGVIGILSLVGAIFKLFTLL
jgi:hypothetical protein